MAPPFLEDVLIELTKSDSAYSAIAALRKANTPKTRAALAQIASGRDDSILRIEAINNLGRSKDVAYLPLLVQLMESEDKLIQNAAAEATGALGGATAVGRLSTLVLSQNAEMRIAGVNGLGNSTAREAVPILIGRLLDADSNVRQAAVTALWLLTQHAAFDGNEWADVSIAESAANVHRRWARWWGSHGTSCEIHGMADCSSAQPLDVGPD